MCQDLTKESPLLVPGGPKISSIYWPDSDETSYEVGKGEVTHIQAYSDSGIVWLAVYKVNRLICSVPANQVSIYFKNPEDTK